MTHYSFEFYGFTFFGIILARYLIFAGGTQLLLDRVGRQSASSAAIVNRFGLTPATIGDIKLSVLSSAVFAISAAAIATAFQSGITRVYMDIHQYPLWYLVVSYIIAIVLQDAYFYFMHRLFHHRLLFRWWHHGHHRSHPPTPWTSFAFDPPEAMAHALFLVGISLLLPLHPIAIIAVLSTMTVWAVVNHLDPDTLPINFPHHWCGRWFTGPAHHAIHHRQAGLHFGLYFTFWDRQLGTQSPKYTQEFADVAH